MSKFNSTKKDSDLTTNNEGLTAFKMNDKEKLITMVLTTMFNETKFYGDNSNELVELAIKLIQEKEGKFVANLAVFARNEMNLRSVSHVLCTLLAKEVEGKAYVKYAVAGVCQRADDITEILACYLSFYGKPIANSLKKALAKAMNKFDEYQFGKYKNSHKEVNFKDVLRITHAKACNDKQNDIFNKIINDNLAIPYTWETELSSRGNTTEVWEELIDSGKVGMMALLRNLNNILNADPENLDKVLDTFKSEKNITRSKILPFRFYSAYSSIENNPNCSSKVLGVLEEALEISTKNIEKLDGKSLVAIDVSGSMTQSISARSTISVGEIAVLLGAIANHICDDTIILTFDDRLKKISLSKHSGIISNAKSIKMTGGGTDISLPLIHLLENKIKVDRIILLSDNEINYQIDYNYLNASSNKVYKAKSCQQLLDIYKNNINPDVKFYGIDLVGYGTQQFRGNNVHIIAGWNERVFEFISIIEEGVGNLVKVIENYDEVSDYVNINAES